MKNARCGFTLIELLVVIAIISMLAGQLLPSLSTAKEKGRQANCISQLRQFSLAIEMYYQDTEDYPNWLSNLYRTYVTPTKILTCLTDLYHGTHGHGNPSYQEVDDIPTNAQAVGRNPEVEGCSYIYEFSPVRCGWFEAAHPNGTPEFEAADTNGDDEITWKEAKMWQSRQYGGQVPIVRCFWHNYNYGQKVLNLAFRDYNVYPSGLEWETTSY